MLQAKPNNVIRFPTVSSDRQTSQIVPKVVRNLTPDELKKLGPLDKALVGLIFSIRNLADGKTDVAQAEREAHKIIELLKRRLEDA